MLDGLMRLKIDRSLRAIPSIDSIRKQTEDYKTMPFSEYITKYYSKLNPYDIEVWNKVILNLINLAFDETRHEEMAYNFGYVDKKHHHFDTQYHIYNQLENDERLPEDIKKFIGFLAGVGEGFFNKYHITVEQWFNMKNWHNPYVENEEGHTINEILSHPYGINYFKVLLTQMPYWRR
jgi:hypothetical protein